MRRSAIALGLFSASAACGLAFSPGDYREDGERDAGPGADGNVPVVEGGPGQGEGGADAGPARTRIALFSGRRDPASGEAAQVAIAETMLTSIDSTGALGPITFDAPPPSPAVWTHAGLSNGRVYVHNAAVLASAPFTDHVNGAWSAAAIPAANPAGLRPWVLDSSGALSGRASAGDSPAAYVASFADGGVSPWAELTAKTTVVRGNTRLVLGGANVYIVGGDTPENADKTVPAIPAHAEIEVAKLDANGALGNFHPTTSLPAVGDGGAFAVFDPIAVASADHLYVLGGNATASALTDQAFAAKIKDPSTGDLEPWVALPKLPQPMSGFAAIVTPSWLVVVGGQLPGAKEDRFNTTDVILRLAIKPDGTFGTSWETAGRLPSGRSGIVGVTY